MWWKCQGAKKLQSNLEFLSLHRELITSQTLFSPSINNYLQGHFTSIKSIFFKSNSIEDFELNQYRDFQLILPMRFYLMRYFVNSIMFRVSHRLLYCVLFYWSRLLKMAVERKILIFSILSWSCRWNLACSHFTCIYFWWYRNLNFFWTKMRGWCWSCPMPL